MLNCSSEEEEVDQTTLKRKGKEQATEKPAKIGKTMAQGVTLTHRLIDLSPYWDGRMTACFGYVPLTIFVPAWSLADKTHMSNRRKQNSSSVTGGRMLSDLASNSSNKVHQQSNHHSSYNRMGQSSHQNYSHDHNKFHNQGAMNHGSNRQRRGRRGRGNSRGNGIRGGGTQVATNPAPMMVINGVVVPKYRPGAFEALKAARQARGSSNGTGTNP
ncbi:uncharacterized protein MELLADRAFT_110179 [Melampsora larici-populina 98AG31]|uniref:Uncharacterized protein n=1 Tax=Melampsora larici-populina (strain 98AG31 / pathotype 3-4-7) TaxID=747676 RepID=F4RYY0_MELLP|nr:uncharacterized protein MELLADRAFT_110179 [Melampsora larici-populina 98AG31]EGG02326.1 hypothetical protein MELLADRAFT_110179 [Melampsora larici-populina 98AG31]